MIAVVPIRQLAIGFLALAACKYRFAPSDVDASLADGADTGDPVCPVTFCDNFDRESSAETGWTTTQVNGNAVYSLSTLASVSAPKSLLVEFFAVETAYLIKSLPLATTSARVSLSLSYASTNPGTAEVDVVALRWDTLPAPCTSFGYYLVRDGTMPFDLQETYGGCGGNENTPLDILDNTGFHEIDMFVTFGPIGTARVRLDLDGVTRIDKLTSHAIAPSTVTLLVGGGPSRNVVAPWQVFIDDIEVDLK